MLLQLRIENFALIDKLSLEFYPRLNVLTGETGAGKSILIDAIRFILGERMDQIRMRSSEKVCFVEAVFEVKDPVLRSHDLFSQFFEDNEVLVLRREYHPGGRTRAWINQRTVNSSILKKIGVRLVDIHGQYDHQLLLCHTFA